MFFFISLKKIFFLSDICGGEWNEIIKNEFTLLFFLAECFIMYPSSLRKAQDGVLKMIYDDDGKGSIPSDAATQRVKSDINYQSIIIEHRNV